MHSTDELRRLSTDIRRQVVEMIHTARMGHMGGSLSSIDILVSLYFHALHYDPRNPQYAARDRFILSKGHSVEGFYAVLAKAGFFPKSALSAYGMFGSILYGHPTRKVPGVEVPSGSLGHGLAVATGMALAAKRDRAAYRVFVLMGDGEQAEGSIWEAAMAAAHYGLDNLVAIVDSNGLQISGTVESVMGSSPLDVRYRSFGWECREVDGHDHGALTAALDALPWCPGRPNLLIARTIKGRGISFMENEASWHHRTPTADEYRRALAELARAGQDVQAEPAVDLPAVAQGQSSAGGQP